MVFVMDLFPVIDEFWMNWLVIPVLIFFARILDVSLGTLRIVFIARGNHKVAPVLGFIEVLIWLVAIGQVMANLNNVAAYLGWAAGFAFGNFIGLKIEQRLAIGQMIVRVITSAPATELVESLKVSGYRTTSFEGVGNKGKVNLVFMIVRRKDLKHLIKQIRTYNPKAFYTIENVHSVSEIGYNLETAEKYPMIMKLFPLRKRK